MKVYVFPGQGSQVKGMGQGLFEEFPELTKKADEILGYSIKELCENDPEKKLGLTQYTQPALFTVNALTYLKKVKETGRKPDYVAGHSLGEYNAIFAAGGFDFETGLKLVKRRGELMGMSKKGSMAAVIGMSGQRIQEVIDENYFENLQIANYNEPNQTAISGAEEEIKQAKAVFEKENARYIFLRVSAAFHSDYMKPAQKEFAEYLNQFEYSELEIPVISNYTAQPYQSKDSIKEYLTEQLCNSVRWVESMQYIMDREENLEFEEIGPGHVLTNLIKKIKAAYVNKDQSGKNKEETIKLVTNWNEKYPVGSYVRCKGYSEKLRTRTEAVVLFGHRAAVYMENYNGYFDLEELEGAQ